MSVVYSENPEYRINVLSPIFKITSYRSSYMQRYLLSESSMLRPGRDLSRNHPNPVVTKTFVQAPNEHL